MQVILLERMDNLGNMGDLVNVKPGYARNFLLPRAKALRATKENIALFDAQKANLEADNAKRKAEAEKQAKKVDGITVDLIRQASEGGQLYGSVTARDIAEIVAKASGEKVDRTHVRMDRNYKMLGLFPIKVALHAEVVATVTVNVARSEEEAKIQRERGEALIATTENSIMISKPSRGKKAEAKAEETTAEGETAEAATTEGEEAAA